MENGAKMEPKREPKSRKNWKKELQKMMRKIIDFLINFESPREGRGAWLNPPFRATGTLRVGNQQKSKQTESKQPNQQRN